MVVEKRAINKTKNALNYNTLSVWHWCFVRDSDKAPMPHKRLTESVCGVSLFH